MRTVRGVFNGNEIELLEAAPAEGRNYVLITFLDGDLEKSVARQQRVSRDVIRPELLGRIGGEVYPRFSVGALMTRDIITIPGTFSVAQATHLMREKGVTSVVVEPDARGEWGIFTMRDVLKRIVGEGRALEETTVDEIATRPLLYTAPNTSLRDCSRLMLDNNIRRVVVKQDGRPVGIISETDIFLFVEERGWGPGQA